MTAVHALIEKVGTNLHSYPSLDQGALARAAHLRLVHGLVQQRGRQARLPALAGDERRLIDLRARRALIGCARTAWRGSGGARTRGGAANTPNTPPPQPSRTLAPFRHCTRLNAACCVGLANLAPHLKKKPCRPVLLRAPLPICAPRPAAPPLHARLQGSIYMARLG